jgi:hypothetical protein
VCAKLASAVHPIMGRSKKKNEKKSEEQRSPEYD